MKRTRLMLIASLTAAALVSGGAAVATALTGPPAPITAPQGAVPVVTAGDLDSFTAAVTSINAEFHVEAALELGAAYCAMVERNDHQWAVEEIAGQSATARVDAEEMIAVASAGRDYLCPDAGN